MRFRSSPHCRYPNHIATSKFNGSVVFLDIRGQINFDRFPLFCIFVRNDISVTASVAIIIVKCHVIAGFFRLSLCQMISIYLDNLG